MAALKRLALLFGALLLLVPSVIYADTPCQSNQQTWLYTVDTSNQQHIVACLSEQSGVVPWFGYINSLPSSTTLTFDASLGNHQKVTIATNVTSSVLQNPIAGEWMFFTIVEDNVGGHTFQQPANFVNWAPINTAANATTTEAGYFDGVYFQVISTGGGGGGGCSNGASNTQYVDSVQGNDANSGLNWCAAKLTEGAAITALGASGGWIYVAPNYTGAVPGSVPSNVHILQTDQLDSHGTTAFRYAYPDWADTTEDHPTFFSAGSSTLADAHTAFTTLGPFSNSNLVSGVTGSVTVPATASAFPSEQAGVAGIVTNNATAGDVAQSDGVYGACYNPGGTNADCSGIVGVAGNNATGANGSYEAGWLNLSLASTPTDAMGLVLRATGGHMPTAEFGVISGRANAAIDVNYGGAAGDAFPAGLYIENSAVADWPIVVAPNYNTAQPHTSVFTFNLLKQYYFSNTKTDTLSVVKLDNASGFPNYQQGNWIWNNSNTSAEIVLPLNHSGTVSVDGINTVAYSATPTFDRSLGKIQTITLTGNVTSSTLTNCAAGQTVIFDIVEDGAGAHTFVAPANMHMFGTIDTTASYHNVQTFYCTGASSYSTAWATGIMVSGN